MEDKPGKYYVLIMDIIESSKFQDRNVLTGKLDTATSRLNSSYSMECFAPFEITRGDEVAGVLTSISRAYEMIKVFREEIYPADIRSVIVYDELKAGLETKRSTIIDGPAFYRGNDTMVELKKTQKTFAIATHVKETDETLDALMNLLLLQWNNLSPLQRKIISLYQQERNQLKVAEMISRKQQQVQQTLYSCKWEIIDSAEKAIMHLFKLIDEANGTARKDK